MGDWQAFVAIAALGISALGLVDRLLSKALTRSEHEEFKTAVYRDFNRVERRIELVEQTRPTTGELEAKFGRTKG